MSLDVGSTGVDALFLCAVWVVLGVVGRCLSLQQFKNKQGLRRAVIRKKGTQHFNRSEPST